MIIDENKAIKKLEKSILNCQHKKCPLCGDYLRGYNIDNLNVGYVKSKLNEVFFHNSCYNRKILKGD